MSRTFAVLVVALFLSGCSRPAPESEQPKPVVVKAELVRKSPAESLEKGIAYLLKQQSEDGAWRSDVYATFKDGTALTPLAIVALQDAHDAGVPKAVVKGAIGKGLVWLAKLSKPDGTIDPGPDGLDYPIYTATLAIKAFSHETGKEHLQRRDGWVKYLKERQLTEKLGWKPEEKQFGGWGYCRVIPKKPEPNVIAPPLIESNLSATLFALDALRTAGESDGEIYKSAAVFVRRCQNYLPLHIGIEIDPLDGGFHFIYDDPTRNKAGMFPQSEENSKARFYSYGSTTADGVRSLALCRQPEDNLRGWAAGGWIQSNFRADTHPGTYVKAHEPNREAVYYYYAASVSRAFRELKLTLPDGRDWAAELGAELAKRQREDGSWANSVELVRENDPIVATCNALSALSRCIK